MPEYSDEEIIKKMISREIKPRDLDDLFGPQEANRLRLVFLERMTDQDLAALSKHDLPVEDCRPNIELMIGAVQVPLGYAGPLKIEGDYAKGDYYVPLATTEGALVASINRGCSIIRKCGQAKVKVHKSGQTRSILLKSQSFEALSMVSDWLNENFALAARVAKGKSQYFELKSLKTYLVGNNLWVRLQADTGDAMGMNMITLAAENLGSCLKEEFPEIEFVSASGNICSDKKASAINLREGRGKYVVAEIVVPDCQIETYLKTTAREVFDLNYQKNWLGGMVAGTMGYNAHFANVVAAVYLATGQDMGHVVEGSQGFTTMDVLKNGLYVAVTLPCLQTGTYGGGTHLPHQKACLSLLGVAGPSQHPGENPLALAEIIAGAVLAGELSLIGALAAQHLGVAHEQLNR